jgi:hypothetical protein
VFFRTTNVSIHSPRFTSVPPQIHHKNTTQKHAFFPKPPAKRAILPVKKKQTLLRDKTK